MHLIDKLAHFDRERIPERVVHAKGAGAHGYFEVTHDISQYCKAKVFDTVGKRTPVFTRFSTVGGEKGRYNNHTRVGTVMLLLPVLAPASHTTHMHTTSPVLMLSVTHVALLSSFTPRRATGT